MKLLYLPYRLLQKLAVFEITKTLSTNAQDLARRSSRPEVQEICRKDLELFLARGEAPYCEELLTWLEDRRTRCFGAVADGRLVAFAWVHVGSASSEMNRGYCPSTGAAIELSENSAFLFHVYTAETARGRGWMSCLTRHIAAVLKDENQVSEIVTTTEIINRPALSLFKKLGFRDLGSYTMFGTCSWSRGWFPKPTAPVLAYG